MTKQPTGTGKAGSGGTSRYLAFSLGQEEFAIPLLSVREVVARPETTPVPFSPPHLVGIMNLRGQVITVFDLRQKFRLTPRPDAEIAVIICDLAPLQFGCIVDSVNSVLALKAEDISPRPDLDRQVNTEFITGVAHRNSSLVLILNLAKALDVEDLVVIKNTANQSAA